MIARSRDTTLSEPAKVKVSKVFRWVSVLVFFYYYTVILSTFNNAKGEQANTVEESVENVFWLIVAT